MNLVGYFPNRKRLTYERHIFQRFLLVLKGNSSFHFLCCITPCWHFQSTRRVHVAPLSYSFCDFCLGWQCFMQPELFPWQHWPRLHKFKQLSRGNSIHLTLLRRISKRPSKWASQQPFLDSFLGPTQFGRHGQVNTLAFWSLEIEQLVWFQWLSSSFHSLFKS